MSTIYYVVRKQPLKWIAFLFLLLFVYNSAVAQDAKKEDFKPSGKIWGYMFGDVFYKAGGDTLLFGKSEYAGNEKNAIGAKLRRVYFGYDYNISPKWSTRFLLETTASTTTPGGNFGVVVKLGYLQYKNVFKFIPNSKLSVGLIPTPVFAFPEKSRGYRSVEKEALDLRGLGNSVDQGASFEGNFDKKGTSGFTVMIGNGSGNKPTVGKYLEYYLSVHKKFFKNRLNLEVMLDHKKIDKELNKTLLRGFVSYEVPKFRVGIEISPNFIDEKVIVGTQKVEAHTQPLLTSFFASPKLHKNVWMFLRYDYLNPDLNYNKDYKYANTAQNYDENLFIAGLQIIIHEKVNIMPNLYINTYNKKKDAVVDRKADFVLRTTVYFIF